NKNVKGKSKTNSQTKNTKEDFSSDNVISIIKNDDTHCKNDILDDVKASTVENILTRHKEASEIMKDSIDIIYSRTKISEDINNDLEEISDELDKLLREE
ncbi:hypothetical protein, partial [Clostridium sp. N3C]|uniref:hypothetical protein n=1 Tax=Clostridium sp. N3C TaxID=1776758 RepID=UPI0015BB59A8